MTPVISIIVPIYKVEKYLSKCLDSILQQTFKKFELILVNDGSPDKCGEICEEYANKDKRVVVINKNNGGLSEARNYGLDLAKGDFIGFVDSDDWIEPDMYETLYNICIEYGADISCCGVTKHYHDKEVKNAFYPLTTHSPKEALKVMLEGELYNEIVCNKLFKRETIGDTRFKVGRIYEDTDFTYKIIHKSEKFCSTGVSKYNYL
ncbi:glycosyltransferase family 2 protein [Jeotgalibacillus sp. S-D1]|uniref:glycosyltransferase family 2 protein n=1 Tax=Jeotgalibacillus sp. S-D1 TaxID=2552189 RepID=UPI001F111DE5|nr:glycosyltransferase family 2 protein [Jeotgalibacillus sp. S-D1]